MGSIARKPPKIIKYLATIPYNLVLNFVLIIPFLIMIYLAFLSFNPVTGHSWWNAPFIGLQNFLRALNDKRFLMAFGRTTLFVVLATSIEFILGLLLALLVLEDFKGKSIAISALIYPLMLPWVVVAAIFFLLFQDYGPINNIFLPLILGSAPQFSWIRHPLYAFIAILIADVWQWTPFMFLVLYSGLSAVSKRLIEAAQVLGASFTQILIKVRLPLIKSLIGVALILRSLEAFKVFDSVWIITAGGPGTSTESLSLYIYRVAIYFHEISYASGLSLIVLSIVMVAGYYAVKQLTK